LKTTLRGKRRTARENEHHKRDPPGALEKQRMAGEWHSAFNQIFAEVGSRGLLEIRVSKVSHDPFFSSRQRSPQRTAQGGRGCVGDS